MFILISWKQILLQNTIEGVQWLSCKELTWETKRNSVASNLNLPVRSLNFYYLIWRCCGVDIWYCHLYEKFFKKYEVSWVKLFFSVFHSIESWIVDYKKLLVGLQYPGLDICLRFKVKKLHLTCWTRCVFKNVSTTMVQVWYNIFKANEK